MCNTIRALALATFASLFLYLPSAVAQPSEGSIRGAVTDGSGAVLPGVTVVASTGNGQVLGTTTTNQTGEYSLSGLPAGPVRVSFELDGFATSMVALMVQPGIESHVSRSLGLASIAETVVVVGRTPTEAPEHMPPPRAPMIIPVPTHDRESVCGPSKPEGRPESLGTILSHRGQGQGAFYIEGDEILIDGGTRTGLEVGRNLVVRRSYKVRESSGNMTAEHTSGLLQITAVSEKVSRAVVVYACDEMGTGDFLASFTPEQVRAPEPIGTPVYWDASRILFGDSGQGQGTPNRLMVIDRGATSGLRTGQRFTLFRPSERGAMVPTVIGDAVLISVRAESSTIRVLSATDAVAAGDWAAPQRYVPPASSLAATGAADALPR